MVSKTQQRHPGGHLWRTAARSVLFAGHRPSLQSAGHRNKRAALAQKVPQNMAQPPYIPAQDGAFDAWFQNFSALITANPTTYGLVSGDATTIAASYTTWHAKFLAATNPATRTSPTVAAKTAQRGLSEQLLRPYAISISQNPAVTNLSKTAVGVNLPNTSRTPVPAPTTSPALSLASAIHNLQTLNYYDTSTPTTKAKPPGATGLELWQLIATTPGTDVSLADLYGMCTKSPVTIGTASGDVGKIATYWGRWATKSGPGGQYQVGPWSAPLSVAIV
jgi:hypothetical protein